MCSAGERMSQAQYMYSAAGGGVARRGLTVNSRYLGEIVTCRLETLSSTSVRDVITYVSVKYSQRPVSANENEL